MTAVVDLAQLRTMTMGEADLAAEALGIFRSQVEVWSRLLDASADPRTWSDACHALKGAARSIGAMPLGEACEAAERLGRTGSPGQLEAGVALSAVKDRLGEAVEAIASLEHQLLLRRTFDGLRLA
jgi:HPt (histidine-containing phosphotransfer) domain-containing protein